VNKFSSAVVEGQSAIGPWPKRVTWTRPLKIGIVGLGFGRWVVRSLREIRHKDLFEIAAICDLDPARVNAIAAETGCRVNTFEELLDDPELAAIGIFTGPVGRAELVRRAIEAGKHVMTTKPFERNSAAARAVLEEAAERGIVVHMNSPAPFEAPDLARIQLWQKKYHLGAPLAGQFSIHARYEEECDGGWLDDPAQCPAAPIFRLGIYHINDAVSIFGEPEVVHVMTSRLFTRRPTPDHAQLSIRFRSGALVNIFASFCVLDGDHYRNSLTLHFERGSIYRNAGAEGKRGHAAHLALVQQSGATPSVIEEAFLDVGSGAYNWPTFFQAIHRGEPFPPDYPQRVVTGLKVIEAMAQSESTGLPVRVAG
jgi:predicted dehydrogenase